MQTGVPDDRLIMLRCPRELECIYNLLALPGYGRNYFAKGNKPKQVKEENSSIYRTSTI